MFLAAAAALPVVLGLQLGAPPALPECQRMVLQYPNPDGSPAPYTSLQSRECVEHGDAAPTGGVDRGMIYFPPDAMASIMSFNWVGDSLIDGRLASLGISTLDYNHADFIVAQLSTKFGKPVSDQPSTEDIDSIGVPSRTVVWQVPGVRVEYDSVGASVERGLVLIQTDDALKIEQQRREADDKKQTPL